MPTFQLYPYFSWIFPPDNLCSTQELHWECLWVSISSLRMERTHNQQTMRREKKVAACGLAKAPPDYIVTLRLWMPRREAVTEEEDEDSKGKEQHQATQLQCAEDNHTVVLRESPSVLPAGSESPFLTCTPDTWMTSASQSLGSQTQPLNRMATGRWRCLSTQSWNPGKCSGHVSRAVWPLFSLLPSVALLLCFLKVPLHQNLRHCDFWGPECSPRACHSGLMWVESHRK